MLREEKRHREKEEGRSRNERRGKRLKGGAETRGVRIKTKYGEKRRNTDRRAGNREERGRTGKKGEGATENGEK